ncbi:MAG: transposase [Nitrospirae bacterium]|nr:transposase [Nitrospirota bacterium]
MVQHAQQHSISQAARTFATTRKTVRKWLKRYQAQGTAGLHDQSKAPHHIPHKSPPGVEQQALDLRRLLPTWGGHRLHTEGRLPISGTTCYRIWQTQGLVKPRRRKHHKKRDLREVKKRFAPFAKLQQDVKDLDDIPTYWPLMRTLGLPPHQLTCREIRTGATFFAYAYENTMTNSQLFQAYVAEHLQKYGVSLDDVILQTDNGSENIGSWKKKTPSAFTRQVEEHYRMQHDRIPPHCSTYNSDVESFHNLIEREFYDIETFSGIPELLGKAYAYQLYFNYQRPNAWREGKSPYALLRELAPDISSKVLALPPAIVDQFLKNLPPGEYSDMASLKISRPGPNVKAKILDKDHMEVKMTQNPSQGGYHLPLLVRNLPC